MSSPEQPCGESTDGQKTEYELAMCAQMPILPLSESKEV